MSTPFAISQLAKKLKLEANVIPKLTKFFREIKRSIQPVMKVTGRVPPMRPFRDDLIELLEKHYAKVAKDFKGDTVQTLTKSMEIKQGSIETVAEESVGVLDSALLTIIALRAPRQADFILETTEKELRKASDKVTINAALEGETLTPAQRGRAVADDFNSRIPGKVDGIAEFETQAMAEETKLTEAQVLIAEGVAVGGIALALVMRKTWNTIIDEVTRDSHVIADGQERSTLRPFTVQGQLLRMPGDTSLGATLDNVMRCRCAGQFTVGGSV